MKLTGYVLEDYNEMPWAYTCKRLIEEAQKQGDDLRLIGVHQTCMDADGVYNDGKRLERRDYLINRYKWNNVKDYVNQLCKLSYNRIDAFNTYVSKYEQLARLDLKSVLTPAYVLGTAALNHSFIVEKLGLPFVAKGLCRSMGREVFLIELTSLFPFNRRMVHSFNLWMVLKELNYLLSIFCVALKAE